MSDAATPSDLKTRLKHAVALYQAARPPEAIQICEQALALDPSHVGVLQLLAALVLQTGDVDRAITVLSDVIARAPATGNAFALRAEALNKLARHDAALADYMAALAINPDDAKLLKARGDTYYALSQFTEALADYDAAIAIKSNFAEALSHRGNTLKQLDRNEEALASMESALVLNPNDAETLANSAVTLLALMRAMDALQRADQAVAQDARNAAAHNVRGSVYLALRRFDDAIAAYRTAARQALTAEYVNNIGLAQFTAGRLEDALASFDQTLALDPQLPETQKVRAETLLMLGRIEEGVGSLQDALAAAPDAPYLRGFLLFSKMRLCDWSDYESSLADIEHRIRAGEKVISPFHYLVVGADPALARRTTEMWAEGQGAVLDRLPDIVDPPRHGKIRIGYFSSDFRDHAVAMLIAEMFERHDRTRFEITGYAFGPSGDSALRRRVRAAMDDFIDVNDQADRDVALLARHRGLDIAVNLNGYTEHGRSGIFAHRVAPVQVNYLGYPGTMAASFMDYIIADPTLVRAGDEADYSEKIVYLPDTYQPNDSKRVISARNFTRAKVGLPADAFVLCCFNLTHKITPQIFACWMRILKAVGGAVLWILEERSTARANLRAHAATHGVDPERLIFAGRLVQGDHLARHRLADLFLDTLPYNAHTTASDALWTGLPVLTCSGATFASRVAASLLNAVGLPELITESLGAYEELAIALARDPVRLMALKARLQHNRTCAPLFDAGRMTANMERAYEAMTSRYHRGLAPDHIRIGAT